VVCVNLPTALQSGQDTTPFTLEFACRVQNADEVEKALHIAFGPSRINPKREFFRIEPEQAIAILKLLHTEDATTEVVQQPSNLDQQSIAAAEELKVKKGPRFNFVEMKIPIDSVLQSTHGDTKAIVVGPTRVKLGDDEMSLTDATKIVLGIDASSRYSARAQPHKAAGIGGLGLVPQGFEEQAARSRISTLPEFHVVASGGNPAPS
jgi:hypothetical protein